MNPQTESIHSMIIKLNRHDLERILDDQSKSFMTDTGVHVTVGQTSGKSEVATR